MSRDSSPDSILGSGGLGALVEFWFLGPYEKSFGARGLFMEFLGVEALFISFGTSFGGRTASSTELWGAGALLVGISGLGFRIL